MCILIIFIVRFVKLSLVLTLEEQEDPSVDLPLGVVGECHMQRVQQSNPKVR